MNEVWCRQVVIKLLVILVHFIRAYHGVSIKYDPANNQNSNLDLPGNYPGIDSHLIQRPQIVQLNVPLYPYTSEPDAFISYDNAQIKNSRIIPKLIIPTQQKHNKITSAEEQEKEEAENEKLSTEESNTPAQYDYGYSVSDPHTGDSKTQYETRRGDVVKGSYSVVDADGTKRTVEYTADPKNGFNAIVRKEKPDDKQVEITSHGSQVDINQETVKPEVNYKKSPSNFGIVRGKFVSIPDGRFKEFIIPSPTLPNGKVQKIIEPTIRRYPGGVKEPKQVYLNHLPLRVLTEEQTFPTDAANLRYFPVDIRGLRPVHSKLINEEQNEVQNKRGYHQPSRSKVVQNSDVRNSALEYLKPVFTRTGQDLRPVHTISSVNEYSSLPFRSYPSHTVTKVPQDVQADILRAPPHVIHRFVTIPVGYT